MTEEQEKLNLSGTPQPREDGMRTTGGPGTFEWWYFDTEFEDGTKTTVVFYTKDFLDVKGESSPKVQFDLALPGKKPETVFVNEPAGTPIQARKDQCKVSIAQCAAEYLDDGSYRVHFEDSKGETIYDLKLTPRIPMWRPGDGYSRFGENGKDFFAWFVAVPSGIAEGRLTIHGETKKLKGTGYHDHNWGNSFMPGLLNHWYWCRASVGEYTVINCDMIASKTYGYTRNPIFMVAKEGAILSDDSPIDITRSDTYTHEVTGKFMDNHLTFRQKAGDTDWTVEYIRERDIMATHRLDGEEREAARKKGMDPSYCRCVGTVRLTRESGGEKEVFENTGIWEQMGFGNEKEAIIR